MTAEASEKRPGIKILLIAALLLIVVGALAAVLYFAVQNYRKVQRYNEAIAAYGNEDWPLAEKLLTQCIRTDRNNEEVVTRLATVYEKLGQWPEAGIAWGRAAKLNAFKPEYVENMLEAFLHGGNFDLLQSELENMQPLKSDRHTLLLALAYSNLRKSGETRRLLKQLKDKDSLSSPLGKLVSMSVDFDTAMTPQKISELEALSDSKDASVAFYSLLALADYSVRTGKLEAAEKYLKKSSMLNPYSGTLALANLYYLQGKTKDAAARYRELGDKLTPQDVIHFGEVLAAINALDELKSLARRYRLGSRENILVGYYLDALVAYCEKNQTELSDKLDAIGDQLPQTAVAQTLQLYNAVNKRDVNSVTELLRNFVRPDRKGKILTSYVNILKPFVIDLMRENDLNSAAQISSLLQLQEKRDAVFSRAIIANAFRKGILSQFELEQALEKFPDDPGILLIAANFFRENGESANVRLYTEKLLKIDPDNISAQLHRIALLESDKQIEKAAVALKSLYYKNPEDVKLLMIYLAFCTRNRQMDDLQSLEAFLMKSSVPQLHAVALLAAAEKASLEQKREKMHQLLMQIVNDPKLSPDDSGNANILFRTAQLLGRANFPDPAIAVYRKLLKRTPDNILMLANLSELYAARGADNDDKKDFKEALELARQAYIVEANSPVARECYAFRLLENKDYNEAERLLYFFVQYGNASPRISNAWKVAMEHIIQKLAAEKETYRRSSLCKSLLRVFPDNQLARQNLADIEELKKKKSADAEAKQKSHDSPAASGLPEKSR